MVKYIYINIIIFIILIKNQYIFIIIINFYKVIITYPFKKQKKTECYTVSRKQLNKTIVLSNVTNL